MKKILISEIMNAAYLVTRMIMQRTNMQPCLSKIIALMILLIIIIKLLILKPLEISFTFIKSVIYVVLFI